MGPYSEQYSVYLQVSKIVLTGGTNTRECCVRIKWGESYEWAKGIHIKISLLRLERKGYFLFLVDNQLDSACFTHFFDCMINAFSAEEMSNFLSDGVCAFVLVDKSLHFCDNIWR